MAANKLVWGISTRLFHWLLVVVFTVSMVTGLLADIDLMEWHLISGYGVLGLLIFRLLSGIFGRDYGRFKCFPLSPRSILAYIRGNQQFVGHNPLGSMMVVVLLLSLIAQVFSGLMTTDEIYIEGPWVAWVSDSWISFASMIHSQNYWLLLILVGLHITAVFFYLLIKRQNLIVPMITGKKELLEQQQAAVAMSPIRLLVLIIVTVVICRAMIVFYP